MLSDTICEACEDIWQGIQDYDYSEEFKEQLVTALVELSMIVYRLDHLEKDCTMTKKEMRELILKRWSRRNCSSND